MNIRRRNARGQRALVAGVFACLALRPLFVSAQCTISGTPEAPPTGDVFVDGKLTIGYDIGVDTDKMRRDWLACVDDACPDCCRMALPSGQLWGAVFVTIGTPKQPPRPARVFSDFQRLQLELRGDAGGEHVLIGIKDACDPDDGTEAKVDVTVGTDWQEFHFDLSRFPTADTGRLYVLTEFVFDSSSGVEDARTVSFRNVRFANGAAAVCGDVDDNGAITVTDGVQVLRAAADLPSSCTVELCDADGTGALNVTDGVRVLRAAAELPTELACPSP